ncbi:MAG TPA: DMT family transporter [Burkholderiaceae bacterium]|nr:DMT family transporter [Burkholderiaceae bacterium]
MSFDKSSWAAYGPTALFVLLWSSGALFAKWGLQHASAFAFLGLRFALAFGVLLLLATARRRWLPAPGTRWRVAATGLLLIGGYATCYLLALDHGLTPGVLATVLGAQPLLTLVLMERRFPLRRVLGLCLALAGLVLVVYDSLVLTRLSAGGIGFALACLACMTSGAMLQKTVNQAPMDVLPLQYGASLLLSLLFLPFQPIDWEWTLGFFVPLLWMGLVISVGATLLLYRLIQAGNLVNVTSLFYLVPGGTAVLDYLVFGNRLPLPSLLGLGAILLGLAQVMHSKKG